MSGTATPGDAREQSTAEASASRPVYSIGAVARMLGAEPATLRAWEERYRVIVPARSQGSHRLYSRDQVEHLRFVLHTMEIGSSAADAHRLLAEQLGLPSHVTVAERDVVMLILLAERDRFAAELCEYFSANRGVRGLPRGEHGGRGAARRRASTRSLRRGPGHARRAGAVSAPGSKRDRTCPRRVRARAPRRSPHGGSQRLSPEAVRATPVRVDRPGPTRFECAHAP